MAKFLFDSEKCFRNRCPLAEFRGSSRRCESIERDEMYQFSTRDMLIFPGPPRIKGLPPAKKPLTRLKWLKTALKVLVWTINGSRQSWFDQSSPEQREPYQETIYTWEVGSLEEVHFKSWRIKCTVLGDNVNNTKGGSLGDSFTPPLRPLSHWVLFVFIIPQESWIPKLTHFI